MAFFIDSVKDVVQRTRNAFRAELPGTDAWLWPNNIYVSAKVIGGAVWEVFGKLAWMDRQRFAMTATGYELERHGLEYGITRKPASFANGAIRVYADYPFVIPSGTQFSRSDGATFSSSRAAEVGKYSGYADINVVADAAGKDGNTVYGTPLTTTLAGVTSAEAGSNGLGQGADLETDASLRDRVLFRKRYPPHGGAEYDYVRWARDLPGVTRAFVAGNAYGRGTIGVWFLMDDNYTAGIPLPSDVAAVQEYIDSVKPVTANVIVQAPVPDCVDITVQGLYPDTQAVRESAAAEIASVFRQMATVGLPSKTFVLHQSWLWQAVANATGEQYHKIAAPATDISFAVGTMPCLRSVKFIK